MINYKKVIYNIVQGEWIFYPSFDNTESIIPPNDLSIELLVHYRKPSGKLQSSSISSLAFNDRELAADEKQLFNINAQVSDMSTRDRPIYRLYNVRVSPVYQALRQKQTDA